MTQPLLQTFQMDIHVTQSFLSEPTECTPGFAMNCLESLRPCIAATRCGAGFPLLYRHRFHSQQHSSFMVVENVSGLVPLARAELVGGHRRTPPTRVKRPKNEVAIAKHGSRAKAFRRKDKSILKVSCYDSLMD